MPDKIWRNSKRKSGQINPRYNSRQLAVYGASRRFYRISTKQLPNKPSVAHLLLGKSVVIAEVFVRLIKSVFLDPKGRIQFAMCLHKLANGVVIDGESTANSL